jgi:outer membrane protein assembly factor BamD
MTRRSGGRRAARATRFGLLLLAAAGCGGPQVSVPPTDPGYEFEVGRSEFESRHWLEAQNHLKRFLDLNPGHAKADSAQYLVGRALFESKSYAEAAVEFAILGREYPRSELRDDAAYQECLSYFKQMRPAQFDPTHATRATNCLNEFLLRYPETSLRGEAEARLRDIDDRLAEKDFRLGVLFAKMKKPEAARIYLEGVVEGHPRSRWVPPALLWIGRSHEQQERAPEAAAIYRRLIEEFPDDEAGRAARERLDDLIRRHPGLEMQPATPGSATDGDGATGASAAGDSASRPRP